MKIITILIGIVGLLIINGCNNNLPPIESVYEVYCHSTDRNVTCLVNDEEKCCSTEKELRISQQCSYNGYVINYVNKIINENCYAIKQKGLDYSDKFIIRKSFEEPYHTVFTDEGLFIQYNTYCKNINTYGDLYCLKDNSTCLIIEGNICELFNITEILKE